MKIICIVGPTAAGKTSVSIKVADFLKKQGFYPQIINGDSRQIYKDFPIITAQPSKEEQKDHPHLLFATHNIDEKSTAEQWSNDVIEIINKSQEKTVNILVGVTGFYFKSLARKLVL